MFEFGECILERFKVTVSKVLGDAEPIALSNLELEHYFNEVLDAMVLRLNAYLASEKLQHIVVRYPKDWWQAFKERFFPKWLLRRFPVQYHEEHYEVRAFYPYVSLPNERHYVRIVRLEKEANKDVRA